jgi:hypothetical protein
MYDYNRKIFYYCDSIVYICVALNIADNEQGLWSGGGFETRLTQTSARYKLLLFNYLQKLSRFPSAETNVQ